MTEPVDRLADAQAPVVHCVNCRVQRALLYGQDTLPTTHKEHRRELIRQRIELLAGVLRLEVLGLAL